VLNVEGNIFVNIQVLLDFNEMYTVVNGHVSMDHAAYVQGVPQNNPKRCFMVS